MPRRGTRGAAESGLLGRLLFTEHADAVAIERELRARLRHFAENAAIQLN